MVHPFQVRPEVWHLAPSTGADVGSAAEATKGVKIAVKASMLRVEGFGKKVGRERSERSKVVVGG